MERKYRITDEDKVKMMRESIFERPYEENEDFENRFSYHAPKEGQPRKYEEIRQLGKDLAYLMGEHCPKSRELSLALTKLEEAVMWANASIARNG